ncbi:hypothetical protein SK128_026453 [Halocaridina rubra]|uniref:Uncharacterized protein n=1 Tax=Halocaridina rubra TaxID=373956 RepID=A0AAN8X157_HALRR
MDEIKGLYHTGTLSYNMSANMRLCKNMLPKGSSFPPAKYLRKLSKTPNKSGKRKQLLKVHIRLRKHRCRGYLDKKFILQEVQ